MNETESHQQCTNRFVELANQLREEGHEVKIISAALMAASGVYATFSAAGNTGGLTPSGVDKVVDMYRRNLEQIQNIKKADAKKREQQAPSS